MEHAKAETLGSLQVHHQQHAPVHIAGMHQQHAQGSMVLAPSNLVAVQMQAQAQGGHLVHHPHPQTSSQRGPPQHVIPASQRKDKGKEVRRLTHNYGDSGQTTPQLKYEHYDVRSTSAGTLRLCKDFSRFTVFGSKRYLELGSMAIVMLKEIFDDRFEKEIEISPHVLAHSVELLGIPTAVADVEDDCVSVSFKLDITELTNSKKMLSGEASRLEEIISGGSVEFIFLLFCTPKRTRYNYDLDLLPWLQGSSSLHNDIVVFRSDPWWFVRTPK